MKFHRLIPALASALSALLLVLAVGEAASAGAVPCSLTGSYSESFDSMGAGTSTPAHWHVGSSASASVQTVAANDGSTGPNAGIAAFNFGFTVGAPDRALGTIPTSGDRFIELRLRNNTGRSIHSFTVRYDGEQWRIGTLVDPTALVLRYSADGIDYVDMGPGFNFTSPRVALPPLLQNVAINGNEPNNRVAGIGGLDTPAAPVPDGAIIYLRWFDADEPGADPGLAIDNFSFSVSSPGGPSIAHRGYSHGSMEEVRSPGIDLNSSPEVRLNSAADMAMNDTRNFRLRNLVGNPRTAGLHPWRTLPGGLSGAGEHWQLGNREQS